VIAPSSTEPATTPKVSLRERILWGIGGMTDTLTYNGAVTSADIYTYLKAHKSGERAIHRRLRGFLRWARIMRYIRENPMEMIPKPDPENGERIVFTIAQMQALLNAAIDYPAVLHSWKGIPTAFEAIGLRNYPKCFLRPSTRRCGGKQASPQSYKTLARPQRATASPLRMVSRPFQVEVRRSEPTNTPSVQQPPTASSGPVPPVGTVGSSNV